MDSFWIVTARCPGRTFFGIKNHTASSFVTILYYYNSGFKPNSGPRLGFEDVNISPDISCRCDIRVIEARPWGELDRTGLALEYKTHCEVEGPTLCGVGRCSTPPLMRTNPMIPARHWRCPHQCRGASSSYPALIFPPPVFEVSGISECKRPPHPYRG